MNATAGIVLLVVFVAMLWFGKPRKGMAPHFVASLRKAYSLSPISFPPPGPGSYLKHPDTKREPRRSHLRGIHGAGKNLSRSTAQRTQILCPHQPPKSPTNCLSSAPSFALSVFATVARGLDARHKDSELIATLLAKLALGFLSELINQRGRRSVHVVGWMVPAILINPRHHLFGILPFGNVVFWLGSVLIECSYIAKNPGSPGSSLNIITPVIFKPGTTRDISLSQDSLFLGGYPGGYNEKQAPRN